MKVMSFLSRLLSLRQSAVAAVLCCATALSAQITGETESNNTRAQANGPVGYGVQVSASISSASDVDWFYFDTVSSGSVEAAVYYTSPDNFNWRLYDSAGTYLGGGTDSGPSEIGSVSVSAAGRYYIEVSRTAGTGTYQLLVTFPDGSGRPPRPINLRVWVTGNAADSPTQPVGGPAVLLMGGGSEVDAAFVNRAYPIANGGDVVVIRTSGSNGYNNYLYNLTSGPTKPHSVETLLLDSVAKANSAYAQWVIGNAELLWVAGGDQSEQLNAWKDTLAEDAIRQVYDRGGVVGGLSAGCAIMGEFMYDPDGVTAVTSAEAVANPYRSGVIISDGFLDLPLMDNMITDTHFRQRDRMGRAMAFMARLRQDNRTTEIVCVAVSENTAMFIDRNRVGYVDGSGEAYVLREDAQTVRTRVAAGQTLIYSDVLRTWVGNGYSYDFKTHTCSVPAYRLSVNGDNTPFYSWADPYLMHLPVTVSRFRLD
ncbi:MAG: Type 1 glutamine amidotransferase-like domain-containing protein [Candidatus Sumerlaeaceae bacterium]|nr:Type 1 glutamine amidotransferase-like domain-containing protein [Candidatus Sumerlaeaceae bacterium]